MQMFMYPTFFTSAFKMEQQDKEKLQLDLVQQLNWSRKSKTNRDIDNENERSSLLRLINKMKPRTLSTV